MKTTTWDLILDPPLDGETNMAVDAELLKSLEKSGETRTVLRFYSWIRPTISLGRNQRREKAVDLEFLPFGRARCGRSSNRWARGSA